jgi:hypothetical protein
MALLRLTALLCSLLLLAGCGHKGPVRPLKAERPGPTTALEIRQQGAALLLSWQLPSKNMDGSIIEAPPVLDIYRMTFDPQDDCPECFDRSTLLFRIEPDLPKPAHKFGNRYLLFDRQVQVGIGYQYKLIVRGSAGEIGKPVILRLTFSEPVTPPQQIEIIPHDRSVALRWQPHRLAKGDTLLGYQIYRKQTAEPGAPSPLNPKPLRKTAFEDFNLENGRSYSYTIRTLIKRDEQVIEGVASAQLIAVPQAGI